MARELKTWPLSGKLFVGLLMFLLAAGYALLIWSIWFDTEMRVSQIIEGYELFETQELVEHSLRYLFWFVGTWGITLGFFLLSSYSEKLKQIFAVVVPLGIFSDIGSMWLIRHSSWFGWQLYFSGVLLLLSFLFIWILIQRELWSNS